MGLGVIGGGGGGLGGLFGEESQTGISRAFRDILFSPIITGISP